MKRAMKLIIPALMAIAVAVTVPFLRSTGGCSCHAPLLVFGSMLGCGESKQPESSPTSGKADNNASISDTASNKVPGKAEHKVTFVEIGSVNCIPCKMMQPIMREIEREYAGQVTVVFHDVWTDAGRPQAKKYGIQAIPTQVFLDRDGKEYYRHVGFFPREELVKILKMKGVN
ncbi:MAG: thioredoxin family protein [Spirochaetes bacterium]|nr:thioredoxin family protein [Spirochaetota bacterium]